MTVRFRTGSISNVLTYLLFPVFILMVWAAPGAAQTSSPGSTTQTQAAGGPDPDLQTNLAEPDFTLSALPTTLRLPSRAFAFRLTHRFTRPIAEGNVGDFFADLFGFDSSARIGLELRYGLMPGTQVAVHRTNDRTIQFSGQHELFPRQAGSAGSYVVDLLGAVEGGNNFSEDFSGSIGAVLSRRFQNRGAIYLHPIVVFNAATDLVDDEDAQHTFLLGVGARVRLGQSKTYVLFEAAPQVAGYMDGVDHVSFGIEKRAGGHVFQLTIANALGTTLRQVARGGEFQGDWFIGFNLSRKFY